MAECSYFVLFCLQDKLFEEKKPKSVQAINDLKVKSITV